MPHMNVNFETRFTSRYLVATKEPKLRPAEGQLPMQVLASRFGSYHHLATGHEHVHTGQKRCIIAQQIGNCPGDVARLSDAL